MNHTLVMRGRVGSNPIEALPPLARESGVDVDHVQVLSVDWSGATIEVAVAGSSRAVGRFVEQAIAHPDLTVVRP